MIGRRSDVVRMVVTSSQARNRVRRTYRTLRRCGVGRLAAQCAVIDMVSVGAAHTHYRLSEGVS